MASRAALAVISCRLVTERLNRDGTPNWPWSTRDGGRERSSAADRGRQLIDAQGGGWLICAEVRDLLGAGIGRHRRSHRQRSLEGSVAGCPDFDVVGFRGFAWGDLDAIAPERPRGFGVASPGSVCRRRVAAAVERVGDSGLKVDAAIRETATGGAVDRAANGDRPVKPGKANTAAGDCQKIDPAPSRGDDAVAHGTQAAGPFCTVATP